MATTKTLTPTNQTITMAAFQGEKPDQRQIADAEGKLADAVNALNSQITSVSKANGTANTTYCSSVPPYMKMGKVCIISGDAVVTTAIPNDGVYILGTGYPTPQTHDTEWTYWGVMINRNGSDSYRVNIAANGLRVAYNAIPTGSYNVFIVYFANSAT